MSWREAWQEMDQQSEEIMSDGYGVYEAQWQAATAAQMAEIERARPFMLLRPPVYPDGNMWCALYGDNLQEGVAGFGETPEKAAADFDNNWRTQTLRRTAPSELRDA